MQWYIHNISDDTINTEIDDIYAKAIIVHEDKMFFTKPRFCPEPLWVLTQWTYLYNWILVIMISNNQQYTKLTLEMIRVVINNVMNDKDLLKENYLI